VQLLGPFIRVKLEGGQRVVPQVEALVAAGIPVMAHIGLTPQSVNAFGGYRVQGRGDEAAHRLLQDAKAMQHAGAFAVVPKTDMDAVNTGMANALDELKLDGISAAPHRDGAFLGGPVSGLIPAMTRRTVICVAPAIDAAPRYVPASRYVATGRSIALAAPCCRYSEGRWP